MIQYLYTLKGNHHSKSSNYLSPYIIMTLLTVFPVVHYIFMNYFIAGILYFNSLLFPPISLCPLLWQPLVCFLHLWICFCFILFVPLFLFLEPIHKWMYTVFVFYNLIYLNQIYLFKIYLNQIYLKLSRFIHVVTSGKVSLFLWLIFHCVLSHIFLCIDLLTDT